jgi:hypothetical protein
MSEVERIRSLELKQCTKLTEAEKKDLAKFRKKADAIRRRLKTLYAMGDSAVWDGCWKDLSANIVEEFGWVLEIL